MEEKNKQIELRLLHQLTTLGTSIMFIPCQLVWAKSSYYEDFAHRGDSVQMVLLVLPGSSMGHSVHLQVASMAGGEP